jgi:hypothetical protein
MYQKLLIELSMSGKYIRVKIRCFCSVTCNSEFDMIVIVIHAMMTKLAGV